MEEFSKDIVDTISTLCDVETYVTFEDTCFTVTDKNDETMSVAYFYNWFVDFDTVDALRVALYFESEYKTEKEK